MKPTVDMAVRLGLRSYNSPGTSGIGDKSIAAVVRTATSVRSPRPDRGQHARVVECGGDARLWRRVVPAQSDRLDQQHQAGQVR